MPGEERGPGADDAGALTLRRQLGQLLLSSFDGDSPPGYLRRRLRAGETAGVIVFARNGGTPQRWRALTSALQRAARGSALVAADQEGGDVRSLPFAGPAPGQPLQGGPRSVERQMSASAGSLRAVGINVNLAPVADVASGTRPVLAGRAYPGGPDAVAQRTLAAVRGLAAGRVGATVKHFPGLGSAAVNTDDAPVTVDAPRALLEERDLAPFRTAIQADVPLVMVSHALYPALDRRRIASQSAPIVTGLLRRRLGFRGVVTGDSLEAESVLARSGVAKAAERAVAAGTDLVLMTGSASWSTVFPRLLARARASPAFRSRIRESAARVLALKRRLGLRPPG